MRPLGTSRALALSIVTAGILTFFYPFITTDPPVARMTRWSCFDIVVQMYNGVLPFPICERCGEPVIRTLLALPFWVAVEYFLMVVALVFLCLRGPARVITWIAAGGAYINLRGRLATRLEFEGTFFGLSRGGHVHYGGLLAAHLVVIVALFLASLDLRDEESSPEARQTSRLPVESFEPSVIDAEIVQENEPVDHVRKIPPRLHD